MYGEWVMNVSREGVHVCRITLPDRVEADAVEAAALVATQFPDADGFRCDLTCWQTVGTEVAFR